LPGEKQQGPQAREDEEQGLDGLPHQAERGGILDECNQENRYGDVGDGRGSQ